jgi:hypothetical protein
MDTQQLYEKYVKLSMESCLPVRTRALVAFANHQEALKLAIELLEAIDERKTS